MVIVPVARDRMYEQVDPASRIIEALLPDYYGVSPRLASSRSSQSFLCNVERRTKFPDRPFVRTDLPQKHHVNSHFQTHFYGLLPTFCMTRLDYGVNFTPFCYSIWLSHGVCKGWSCGLFATVALPQK